MIEVTVEVTAQIAYDDPDCLDYTGEYATIQDAENAVVEAVREALKFAEQRGFNHPWADFASVSIADVKLGA